MNIIARGVPAHKMTVIHNIPDTNIFDRRRYPNGDCGTAPKSPRNIPLYCYARQRSRRATVWICRFAPRSVLVGRFPICEFKSLDPITDTPMSLSNWLAIWVLIGMFKYCPASLCKQWRDSWREPMWASTLHTLTLI